jgi:hypothetical protein
MKSRQSESWRERIASGYWSKKEQTSLPQTTVRSVSRFQVLTDNILTAGWTPLHHAALLAPTSLISYLLSHGASPLALSRRKLTPLDVITAHSDIPGRESAAVLLRDAAHSLLTFEERQRMSKLGWRGDERREAEREKVERREVRRHRKQRITEDVTSVLEEELGETSWGWGNDEGSEEDDFFEPSDLDDEDSDGYDEDTLPVRDN